MDASPRVPLRRWGAVPAGAGRAPETPRRDAAAGRKWPARRGGRADADAAVTWRRRGADPMRGRPRRGGRRQPEPVTEGLTVRVVEGLDASRRRVARLRRRRRVRRPAPGAYLLEHLAGGAAARRTRSSSPSTTTRTRCSPAAPRPSCAIRPSGSSAWRGRRRDTVVVHFTRPCARPYDRFVDRLGRELRLAGFLMTPDAAFGYQRGDAGVARGAGRPAWLGGGRRPAFEIDGRPSAARRSGRDRRRGSRAAGACGPAACRRGESQGAGGERAPVPAPRRPAP
jgi:hypothetical protein